MIHALYMKLLTQRRNTNIIMVDLWVNPSLLCKGLTVYTCSLSFLDVFLWVEYVEPDVD